MSPQEFTDALSFAMGLPDTQIVGFKDMTGLIITPSQVCKHPEVIRADDHEIMLRPNTRQNFNKVVQPMPRFENQYYPKAPDHQRRDFDKSRSHNTSFFSPDTPQTPHQTSFDNVTAGRPRQAERSLILNKQPTSRDYNVFSDLDELNIIELVYQMPTDHILTENLKQRVVNFIRMKDKGIIGAFMLYQDDQDFEGFKARVIHKILTPAVSRETSDSYNNQTSRGSSFSKPSTAQGGQRRRNNPPPSSQDQYLSMVHEVESKGLVDEKTASIIKTLLLEENVDVYRKFSEFQMQNCSDHDLGFKLQKLAVKMIPFCERPQSPLPKRKLELMTYVNSLARYHFSDPDDIQLLQKLIHDENEFVLSTFDVFDSDQDHENLIDSLQRIIEKSKTMGIHLQSVQATSFYNDGDMWGQRQSLQNEIQYDQRPQQAHRVSRPRSPSNGDRFQHDFGVHQIYPNSGQIRTTTANSHDGRDRYNQNQRTRTLTKQRIYVTKDAFVRSEGGYEFRPTTTVHDVALIPNYFSSGEEDQETREMRENQSLEGQMQSTGGGHNIQMPYGGQNIYKTPTTNGNLQRQLQTNLQANYFYRTPGSHQMRSNSIDEYQFSLGMGSQNNVEQQQIIEPRSNQILIKDGDFDINSSLEQNQERPHRGQKQQRPSSQTYQNNSRYPKQAIEAPRFIVGRQGGAPDQNTAQAPTNNPPSTSVYDLTGNNQLAQQPVANGIEFQQQQPRPKSMNRHIKPYKASQEQQSDKKRKKHKKKYTSSSSQDSSSSNSSEQSSSSYENRKKNKLSLQSIEQIIQDKRIETAMRSDLFIFMKQNLRNQSDRDLVKIFKTFLKDRSSSKLLTTLMMHCEDKLQLFFERNFTNLEVSEILKLRKARDSQYIQSFQKFNKNGNSQTLIITLKQLIESTSEDDDEILLAQKDQLRNILQISLQSKLFSDQDTELLEHTFEYDSNIQLFKVLSQYQVHNDYLKLTKQVKEVQLKLQLVEKMGDGLISEKKTFQSAIQSFVSSQKISSSETKSLLQLKFQDDKNLGSIWDVYQLIQDENDFLESLKVLLNFNQQPVSYNQSAPAQIIQPLLHESSDFDRADEQDKLQSTMTTGQIGGMIGGLIKMMPMEDIISKQSPTHSSERQQQQQQHQIEDSCPAQHDSPDTSYQQQVPDNLLGDMVHHQHIILRKYAMTGMISYADAPAFHNLVDKRDYRIVCCFEVFSRNRSEDDFLENLALIAQIIKEQEDQQDSVHQFVENQGDQGDEIVELIITEEEDPFTSEVTQLVKDQKLTEDQSIWLLEKHQSDDQMVKNVFKAFVKNQDHDDFVHSLSRLHQKYLNTVQVPQSPFLLEIETLLKVGKLSLQVGQFCREFKSDRKIMSAFSAFQRTLDQDDFVHTVTRLFAKMKT